MGLLRRKGAAAKSAGQRTAQVERLRAQWEEHMARLPPHQSGRAEFVECRAQAAEFDIRASRFVGAVLAGHAQGLQAPDTQDARRVVLALLNAATEAQDEAEIDEAGFHIASLDEAALILEDAQRLQSGLG